MTPLSVLLEHGCPAVNHSSDLYLSAFFPPYALSERPRRTMWYPRRSLSFSYLAPSSSSSLQLARRVVQRQRVTPPDTPSHHPSSRCPHQAIQDNISAVCCMQSKVPSFSSSTSGTSCRSFSSFSLSSGTSPRHPSRACVSAGSTSSRPPRHLLFVSSVRPSSSSRLYHHSCFHSSLRTTFSRFLPSCSSFLSFTPPQTSLRQVPRNASSPCSSSCSSCHSMLSSAKRERRTSFHDRERTAPPLSPFFFSFLPSWCRSAHKFAAPPCPNLLLLRRTLQERFHPILFYIKNDTTMGNYVYDQHFKVRSLKKRELLHHGEAGNRLTFFAFLFSLSFSSRGCKGGFSICV